MPAPSMTSLKRLVFLLARTLGLFALSRRLYRNRVRVLCYHGFELRDESRFLPKLYMPAELFRERMHLLRRKGYAVISLDAAVDAWRRGVNPEDAVVITIDDGWHGIFRHALPVLEECGFPATLYLTSYYFDRPAPVFPLAVRYLFWRSPAADVDLAALGIPAAGSAPPRSRDAVIERIVDHGQALQGNAGRVDLLNRLAAMLGFDYEIGRAHV